MLKFKLWGAAFVILTLCLVNRVNRVQAQPVPSRLRLLQTETPASCESSSSASDFNNQGRDLYYHGDYANALLNFNCALEQNDSYAEAYLWRGNTYTMQQDYQDAIVDLTQAILLQYSPLDEVYYYRSQTYVYMGDFTRALTDIDQAIQINPRWSYSHRLRGTIDVDQGNYQQGVDDYSRAIELDPSDPYSYADRAIAYQWLQDSAHALDDFNQAITLNPQFDFAYSQRANLYTLQDDYTNAVADYTSAIAISPQQSSYYYGRGVVYYYLKDFAKAIADYSSAIDLTPTSQLYIVRGEAYGEMGEDTLAIADFEQASKLAPTDAWKFYSLAQIAFGQEHYEDALQNLKQAIQADATFSAAYGLLGTTYYRLGMNDNALRYYHTYLQMTGASADAVIRDLAQQLEQATPSS